MMFDSAMFDPADASHGAQVLDPESFIPVVGAALAEDLNELREWLAGLDSDAYGTVFIESEPDRGAPLIGPDHVTVTHLRPRERSGAALAGALDGWFAEWLWVDASQARSLKVFTARHAGAAMAGYLQRFECRLEKRWPGCSSEGCPRLRAAENM